MRNLMRAEFYKLKRNKMFWMLFMSMALWGIIYAVLITLSSKGILSIDLSGGFMFVGSDDGPRFNATRYSATGMATFLMTLRSASNPIFLSLFLGMFAGFFISNDYKTGVIKNVISCGRRRVAIFISKWVVFFNGVIVIWLIFPLIAAFGAMLANGFNTASDGIYVMLVVRILCLAIVQLAAFSTLLVLIGVMVEESGKAIILSIVIITGLTILFVTLGSSFSVIRSIYEYTIIFQMFGVVYDPTLTTSEILRCLGIGLITMIVLIVAGIGGFERKEVK